MSAHVLSLVTSFLLSLGFACSQAPSGPPQPQLCEIDGGRWCSDCTGGDCTEGKKGWLCCAGGVCVPVTQYADCTQGVCGWCNNYTTSTSPTGTTTAQCHD